MTNITVTSPVVALGGDSPGGAPLPQTVLASFVDAIATQGVCSATAGGDLCGGLAKEAGVTLEEDRALTDAGHHCLCGLIVVPHAHPNLQ